MKVCYSIFAAVIVVSCMVPMRTSAQNRTPSGAAAAAAKPTPRLTNGHPDLTGSWGGQREDTSAHLGRDGTIFIDVPPENGGPKPRTDRTVEEQFEHVESSNSPPYKPELLAKVKELGSDEVHNDPNFHCKPPGVPRGGIPQEIVESPAIAGFIYAGEYGWYPRLVPTDGSQHRTDVDPSYFGDSVGHWEGDTLVVDVTQFNEDTWLANGSGNQGGSGFFHSDALHVVERFTRKGDTLHWEATVEDPKVLTKPWTAAPQTRILSNTIVAEEPFCEERETPHMVNKY